MAAKTKKRVEVRHPGKLLVIGGAEDPDEGHMKILPRFVELAGGKKARIIVCGSPSEDPKDKERKYDRLFEKIGVAHVTHAGILERHDAEKPELLEAAERATGVFFTGGDQLRLTSTVAGTRFDDVIRHRIWSDRLVVAGTSAGAAAMSSTMVIRGRSDGTVRRSDISLAPGLGFWRDVFVDTHFSQRGRVSRVLAVVSQNPQVIGIGIDENTAVELTPGEEFVVIGDGAVSVFDGRVTHSNAADSSDDDVLAVTDTLVHVLPAGYGFDLREKRPFTPDGKRIIARTQGN
jgi:cyanophycinase